MNHIELFAGCGGLSLGLHAAGFNLLMANELSPMAAESFAFNFFQEDLSDIAQQGESPRHSVWIASQFEDLKSRLRENPYTVPPLNSETGYSDLPDDIDTLKGKLVVGSIIELNQLLASNDALQQALSSGFGEGEVDLVSGGPPCQSFSLAGLRNRDCERNTLPWEFAKFVSYVQPKVAMLENVSGILRAFKDEHGERYHAWFEVAKAFASIGYVPLCLHINARLAGVPQNRPRFIMLGLREDCFQTFFNADLNEQEVDLLAPSQAFYESMQTNSDAVRFGDLPYFDASRESEYALFAHSFLNPLVGEERVDVSDALDDLKFHNPSDPSDFVRSLNRRFDWLPQRETANHDQRNNGVLVKRRFRLYQILQRIDNRRVTKDVLAVLKGNQDSVSDDTWLVCRDHPFLQENGELSQFTCKDDFESYLIAHPTKKQTQKALHPNMPAPAALSIPDDACHYDEKELRVLTVREMARIQSFPDNFVFRSKVTTGGQNRKFEVPQYTQVGNAVPPLLGLALGRVVSEILNRLENAD
jgi:DNA (cytosine-5)-methyltransferase 1